MKKLFLLSLLVSQFAFSQTEKGKFIISGSTSTEFSFAKTKAEAGGFSGEQKTTAFDIKPSFGYFVADNLFIGVSGIYDFTHTNDRVTVEKSRMLIFMQTVGNYFHTENKMRHFVTGGIGIANNKYQYKSNGNNFDPSDPGFNTSFTNKLNGLSVGLAAGVGYFVTDNFSIDAQVAYNYVNLKLKNDDYESKTSGVGLRVGFSIFL